MYLRNASSCVRRNSKSSLIFVERDECFSGSMRLTAESHAKETS